MSPGDAIVSNESESGRAPLLRRLGQSAALKVALAFLLARILLTFWMWMVGVIFNDPLAPDPQLRPYLGVAAETNPWLEPWQRWDVLHYQAIAERGYLAFADAAFAPPLFPLLTRIVAEATGSGTLLSGIIVANLAYLAALLGFHQLARDESEDPDSAQRAVVYLLFFPSAFFFFAGYTEALFLLGAVMAMLLATRRRWVQSGCWAAIAALTRLPGALLAIPLGYLAWGARRSRPGLRPWAAPLGALAGASIFPAYLTLWLKLPPWTPLLAQAGRTQGSASIPGMNLLQAIERILAGRAYFADRLDVFFLILFAILTVAVWRGLSPALGIYNLTFLLLYLIRQSAIQPLLGTARYVLILFPAFILLGQWGRRKAVHRLILYSSLAGLLLLSGQFARWGWVG